MSLVSGKGSTSSHEYLDQKYGVKRVFVDPLIYTMSILIFYMSYSVIRPPLHRVVLTYTSIDTPNDVTSGV